MNQKTLKPKYYRDIEEVEYILSSEAVYMHTGFASAKLESCLREVMLRLPPNPYEDLFDTEFGVRICNTGRGLDAMTLFLKFPCPLWTARKLDVPPEKIEHPVLRSALPDETGRHRCRVIVLNPYLERRPKQVIIGTIAHELAHAYLWHGDCDKNMAEKELEANNLASEWGFSQEIEYCNGCENLCRRNEK